MSVPVKQLFADLFQAQKALGEESAPISAETLSTFVKNLQAVGKSVTHTPSVDGSRTNSMASSTPESSPTPSVVLPNGSKQEQWAWLKNKVLTCPHCLSHLYPGKKLVFGSGNLDAEIFFCGEAPGADEEEQGEVFVGRAGQLLTKIIEAMGIKRSDVYIGNIMNWRPETPNHIGNRPPTQEEMQFCLPYLKGQVEIVKPKVIVALGATAVSGLLGPDSQRRMRDCRGNWFEFNGTPLMVTYHPSYLLRNATNVAKRIVWEDMLQVMKFLNMPISERQKNYFL